MQDDVILEIPGQCENPDGEPEWQPPVLKLAEAETDAEALKKSRTQSCADVFFVQYIICICILTILFSVRIYDESAFRNVILALEKGIHAPTEPWVEECILLVKSLWS